MKSEGAISAYGLGVNEVQICLDVMEQAPLDCILLAGRYTLLDRAARRELLPLCEKTGTSLVIGGVFNSGILATGPVAGAHFDYGPADDDILRRVTELQRIAVGEGSSARWPLPCSFPFSIRLSPRFFSEPQRPPA